METNREGSRRQRGAAPPPPPAARRRGDGRRSWHRANGGSERERSHLTPQRRRWTRVVSQ